MGDFNRAKRTFREVLVSNTRGVDTPFHVDDGEGSDVFSVSSAGNVTASGTSTLSGNVTISTGSTLEVTDDSGLSINGTAVDATAAEINRVADVSGRIVTLTGDTTMVEATHDGKTMLLGEVGGDAQLTVTLPAASGSGAIYRFIVSVVNTSDYVIDAGTNGADFVGNIFTNSTTDSPDLAQPWPAAAADNTITLNGTTSGGQAIGDWIEVQDILTNEWFVLGFTTTSGATEITPFSTV